jgi:hypothetical protein
MEHLRVPEPIVRPDAGATNNFKTLFQTDKDLLLLTGAGTCGCQQPS